MSTLKSLSLSTFIHHHNYHFDLGVPLASSLRYEAAGQAFAAPTTVGLFKANVDSDKTHNGGSLAPTAVGPSRSYHRFRYGHLKKNAGANSHRYTRLRYVQPLIELNQYPTDYLSHRFLMCPRNYGYRLFWVLIFFCLFIFIGANQFANAQNPPSFKVGKLKYNGGGDWYANPSSLPNFYRFFRENTTGLIHLEEEVVEPSSPSIFQYPMLYMTGHGNVIFDNKEVENLRKYMLAGGLLLADDNYGMFPYITREIKKIFPEYELKEVPFQHEIYKRPFVFPNGIPKIHEHDGKPAQLFGIFHQGRILALITYECDLGDGWEDPEVHKDPEEVRQKAFQMGTNILFYVLTH